MTPIGPQTPRPSRRARPFHRRALGAAALLGVGLVLAACGRKGAPEYDSGEPVVKSNTNQLIPGLNLPQKADTPKPKVPSKGNFILDPLL